MLQLVSAFGLVTMLVIAWLCSADRKRFPWRAVGWGLALQFVFAFFILRTDFGLRVFDAARRAALKLIDFSNEGAKMVFGPLANSQLLAEKWGEQNAFIFVISVTATIIVVSALSSLLYHWGVLQQIVRAAAWVMRRAMRTSGSESLAAAANIFMGQTEAPLVVKPYLARMTQSELLALMIGGMATVAGGVLVAYISFGVSAGHLLTASVMSAPAALMMAKIMLPETEQSETASGTTATTTLETRNGIDALCRGASDGATLAINVMAMLIAFVAIVAMANYLLGLCQRTLGVADPVTLQALFGFVNAPFAWLMGVPWKDCFAVGEVLGERIVLNEFFGYLSLTNMNKAQMIEPRSFTIATYALCGFANFASIAIQIGGIGALAPSRRSDLARLGIRAMVGGLLACYITACVAGILTAS